MKTILALLLLCLASVICLSTGNSYAEGVPNWSKEEEDRYYREQEELNSRNGAVKGCACEYCRSTRDLGRPSRTARPHTEIMMQYRDPNSGEIFEVPRPQVPETSDNVTVTRIVPAKKATARSAPPKAAAHKPKKLTITITISFD